MAHEEGGNIQAIAVKRRRLHSVYLAIHMMAQSSSSPHDMALNTVSWQAEFTELFRVSLGPLARVNLVAKAVMLYSLYSYVILHSKDSQFKSGQ